MSRFHWKIIHHTKNQKDLKLNEKTMDRFLPWDDKNIIIIQQIFYNRHSKNALVRNFEHTWSKWNRRKEKDVKKNRNGNFGTKNDNNPNKNLKSMDSAAEQGGKREDQQTGGEMK